MIHRVFLELLLAQTDLVHDLHELTLDKHLFLLGHSHNDLFVLLIVVGFEGSSSLFYILLFLGSKLTFSIMRANLKDLKEVIELHHASAFFKLDRAEGFQVIVETIITLA